MKIINSEYTFKKKLRYTLFTVFKIYLGIFVFQLLMEFLKPLFVENSLIDILTIDGKDDPIWIILISGFFFAPVIEELLFRHPLIYSKYNIVIASIVILYSGICLVLKFNSYFLLLFLYGIYLCLIYFIQKLRLEKNNKILLIVHLIITTIIFGLFHVKKLDFSNISEYWFPFIKNAIPMLILGIGLAKIRLKFNTYWSITAHSVFNVIPAITLLINNI